MRTVRWFWIPSSHPAQNPCSTPRYHYGTPAVPLQYPYSTPYRTPTVPWAGGSGSHRPTVPRHAVLRHATRRSVWFFECLLLTAFALGDGRQLAISVPGSRSDTGTVRRVPLQQPQSTLQYQFPYRTTAVPLQYPLGGTAVPLQYPLAKLVRYLKYPCSTPTVLLQLLKYPCSTPTVLLQTGTTTVPWIGA